MWLHGSRVIRWGTLILCLGTSLGACGSPDTPIEYNPGCSVANLAGYIDRANSRSAPAVINLESGCDYELTESDATDTHFSRLGDEIISGLPAISSEITIMGNDATITVDGQSFGHFLITSEGNLKLYDLTLRNGNRISGGAVYNDQGHLFASNVQFTNNMIEQDTHGSYCGGAIMNAFGRAMILDNSRFVYNGTNSLEGGAFCNVNGFLHVEDVTFHGNTSEYGGAIHIERTDPDSGHEGVLIYDSVFTDNSAGSGGAISSQGENTIFNIEGTSFTNNSAGIFGGAIYLSNSILSLSTDTFTNNHANDGGAIISHEGSHLTINNSQFQGNSAITHGGGLVNAWGELEISNSTFSNNQAERGGGIFGADPVVINQSIIEYNSAEFGGGIYIQERFGSWCGGNELPCAIGNSDLYATITNTTFQFNEAERHGGGIFAIGDLTVEKCTVYANSAGAVLGAGGGIDFSSGNFKLINSTITANYGGGVMISLFGYPGEEIGAEIIHSTIAANTGTDTSGFGLATSGKTEIHNTIIAWNNPGPNCEYHIHGTGDVTVDGINLSTDLSCNDFTYRGINPDIQSLADNGGPTMTHALEPSSIAIDITQDCGGLDKDQRGVDRPQGDDCDIGAYEYQLEQGGPSPRCELFPDMRMSTVLLDIPPGSSKLTIYVHMPGGVPGLEVDVPGDEDPWDYTASLGDTQASECSYQGYTARLYCTFDLPDSAVGAILPLQVFVNECENPIFTDPKVSILVVFPSDDQPPGEPALTCSAGLGKDDCQASGGTYSCGGASACSCVCP